MTDFAPKQWLQRPTHSTRGEWWLAGVFLGILLLVLVVRYGG